MITVTCNCGETYLADSQHAGHQVKCRKCGQRLTIPAVADSPSPSSAAAASPSSNRDWQRSLRKSSRWKNALQIAVASVIGFLLALWAADRTYQSPTRAGDSFREIGTVATETSPKHACPVSTILRPESGTELISGYNDGRGELRVVNGTGSDAVVGMFEEGTEIPQRAMYIQKGDTGVIRSVATGRYRLRFQLGSSWLAESRFCNVQGTSEFDSAFNFAETIEERASTVGVRADAYQITLHPVVHGTAKTHAIAEHQFKLPASP